jgi:uncharacterized Rmd1/YagE family protein
MPYCNNCGRNIPSNERVFKRQMYSGTSHRTNFGKRITFGTSKYYSMKTVCEACARQMDESSAGFIKTIVIILMVFGILIALYFLLQ